MILPQAQAGDFLRYCQRNLKPCPVLAVSEPGHPDLPTLGADIDIRTDVPRYRVWRRGELLASPYDIRDLWRDDLVTFVIGCSFSFEWALMDAGLPQPRAARQERRHVPHEPADRSCRPLPRPDGGKHAPIFGPGRDPRRAGHLRAFPTHGAPVHLGDPALIGIADLARPDYGDAVELLPGELPGVLGLRESRPQAAIVQARLEFCITHAPGAMLITDLLNQQLASF